MSRLLGSQQSPNKTAFSLCPHCCKSSATPGPDISNSEQIQDRDSCWVQSRIVRVYSYKQVYNLQSLRNYMYLMQASTMIFSLGLLQTLLLILHLHVKTTFQLRGFRLAKQKKNLQQRKCIFLLFKTCKVVKNKQKCSFQGLSILKLQTATQNN